MLLLCKNIIYILGLNLEVLTSEICREVKFLKEYSTNFNILWPEMSTLYYIL